MLPQRRATHLGLSMIAAMLLASSACNGSDSPTPTPEPTPPPGGAGPSPGEGADEPPPMGNQAFTRRNIGDFTPAQLTALRAGITAMRSRPVTDPTSWQYQANIHGAAQGAAETAWNSCQHGSFFFLSWHRMYLYYFERILRASMPEGSFEDFALPYWDYSDANDPNHRRIPEPYRVPANESANALFRTNRNGAMNAGGLLPSGAVSYSAAYALTNFSAPPGSPQSFGGQQISSPSHGAQPHSVFERTPHDVIHGSIGGLMGRFETAAQDPVFWLHHTNIDRLWEGWLAQGGGRANPTGGPWATQPFTFFDENGDEVTRTGAEIVDTAAQLQYRYDVLPAPMIEEEEEEVAPQVSTLEAPVLVSTRRTEGLALEGEPVQVSIPVVESEDEEPEGRLLLRVEGISFDEVPEGYYEVYVNLPEGEEPDPKGPYYVGPLTFFGLAHGSHAEGEKPFHAYAIDDLVKRLKEAGRWAGEIDVRFVQARPVPPPDVAVEEAEPARVTIESISVVRQ